MVRSSRTPVVGSFVWTFDEPALGKISAIQNDRYTVRFFRPANESFEQEYGLKELEPAYLRPHTRVFVSIGDGTTSVGRVYGRFQEPDGLYYDIQFPNQQKEILPEADLQARCFLPIEDPAANLAAGGMETQYFHDRRRAALEALSQSRAASYGLTGLLSASVELLPHQVDVVRRVLNDSLQRYLLADEVGLGKTIEACAIIRQAIFDNPSENVVVLAPATLTQQWSRELSWRFFIESPECNMRVLPYEKLHSIDPSEVDTLVIDEAHNLISSNPSVDRNYQAIEALSSQVHRLLLISATPVLGNETTLLALLHLLDPQNYRMDEEAAFRDKVKNGQEFGRLLLALNPNRPAAFLHRTLDQIVHLTPSDEMCIRLVAEIKQSISDKSDTLTSQSVSTLHRHISETYRLYQRLIRTRRRDLTDQTLNDRVSVLETLFEDEDDRSPIVVDRLDQWRNRSLEGLAIAAEADREDYELHMAERNALLHEALGISVEKCGEELERQLADIKKGNGITFNQDEGELALALAATKEPSEFTRIDMAVSAVRHAINKIARISPQPKIVAFGSSTEFAKELADQIKFNLFSKVFSINQGSSEEEIQKAYTEFLSSNEPAVLVCDQRGEEGLNLQFAHGIIHLDLPLAPARIEQRIGRLDRVGRKQLNQASPIFINEIHHWVISPFFDGDHPWAAWFELLRDGFKVFDQSISEVQFLLEGLESKVKLALYHRGASGLKDLETEIIGSIDEERQRLDEQYALDSRSIISGDTKDAFDEILKTDVPAHFAPVNHWLTEVLHFGRFSLDEIPSGFQYKWTDRTLLPKENRHPAIDEESFEQKLTYQRSVAAFRRGVRLVRPGLELVDQIEDYLTKWDDRGTAFATWKTDPEWAGGIWLGFRLVFLLEANVDAALGELGESVDVIQTSSLRRRMDSLLPPWMTTTDVDIEMKPIENPMLQEILNRPYSDRRDEFRRRDFNLGSRRDALYDAIGFDELAAACKTARETSESLLRASDQFQVWIQSHAAFAINQTNSDNERLLRRQEAIIRETGIPDPWIERDMVLNMAISSAMTEPLVRLDSIGLFIVSSEEPSSAQAAYQSRLAGP